MLVADGLLDAAREIDAEDLHSYLQVFQMFNRDHTPLLEATVAQEEAVQLLTTFFPNLGIKATGDTWTFAEFIQVIAQRAEQQAEQRNSSSPP